MLQDSQSPGLAGGPAMIVSAQVAIYPLRQQRLTFAIEALVEALKAPGLHAEVGPMSTTVVGGADRVFAALHDGFTRAAEAGHVVMTVTVSNACPVER
jgi:uncharacterized protein YqgV (UPF0045/DUF77 family)